MDLESVASLIIRVLFFATWAMVGFGLVWVLVRLRRTPQELLQLRVFQNIRELERGLGALAGGTFAGLISLSPRLFYVDPPVAWTFVWTVLWSLPTMCGGWRIFRLFHIPEGGPGERD